MEADGEIVEAALVIVDLVVAEGTPEVVELQEDTNYG